MKKMILNFIWKYLSTGPTALNILTQIEFFFAYIYRPVLSVEHPAISKLSFLLYIITDYLPTVPSLKLLGQSVLELSVALVVGDQHDVTLTFELLIWISIGVIYSWRNIYLPSLKIMGQGVLELLVVQGTGDQDGLWPSDPNAMYSTGAICLPAPETSNLVTGLKFLEQSVLDCTRLLH